VGVICHALSEARSGIYGLFSNIVFTKTKAVFYPLGLLAYGGLEKLLIAYHFYGEK
jgi:hypothetical protein